MTESTAPSWYAAMMDVETMRTDSNVTCERSDREVRSRTRSKGTVPPNKLSPEPRGEIGPEVDLQVKTHHILVKIGVSANIDDEWS